MPAKMYNPQNDLRMLVQISKFYIPKVSFQDFKNVYRILSKLLCQLLGNRIKRLKLINILRQFHSFPVQPLNNQNRNASNKKKTSHFISLPHKFTINVIPYRDTHATDEAHHKPKPHRIENKSHFHSAINQN